MCGEEQPQGAHDALKTLELIALRLDDLSPALFDTFVVKLLGGLLSSAASVQAATLTSLLQWLGDIGLGDIAKGDTGMARSACTKLSIVFNSDESKGETYQEREQAVDAAIKHRILRHVSLILRGGFILLFAPGLCEREPLQTRPTRRA